MSSDILPARAAEANKSTLKNALADSEVPKPHVDQAPADEDEGQELEMDGDGPSTIGDRTVFDDPKTFNVKHPLYTPWTLWYDSNQTKGKSFPTPSTPLSAVPATPTASAAQSWMDDIKKVISFDSVEEFWGLYNNIVLPSGLPPKANYYLFKDGIIPAWEDAANKDGGKWSIQMPRDKNKGSIDQMWLYTMLAAIGETFDKTLTDAAKAAADLPDDSEKPTPPRSIITGVICSARPMFYRLSIWTRLAMPAEDASTSSTVHSIEQGQELQERILSIGRHWKTIVLGYAVDQKLENKGKMETDVEFQSHKDSEKKGKNSRKWTV